MDIRVFENRIVYLSGQLEEAKQIYEMLIKELQDAADANKANATPAKTPSN